MYSLDPYVIRKDFPLLEREVNNRRLVYFDNAASSLKPIQVINTICEFYKEHYSNVFRGVHTLSREATEMYEETRDKVKKFIGAKDSNEVIFTLNATDSLNMVALGWGEPHVEKGDRIVTTVMEHHSNLLPWMRLARSKGAELSYIDIDHRGVLNYSSLSEIIDERTRIVAITHMSNVLGTINKLKEIVRKAHEVEAVVVLDGAQSVPHMRVNVRELGVDFLAFSGHKMLAPTGIGVLWGRIDLLEDMMPYRLGGGAIRSVEWDSIELKLPPLKFEAGTPNIAGAIGLGTAIDYLSKIGMDNVRRHEERLVEYTLTLFKEELTDSVKPYGPEDPKIRGGIISFNLKGYHHHTIGVLLDSKGIAVRTGQHCAALLHKRLGVSGTVRVSYYIYNTVEEVEYLVHCLKEFAEKSK